MCFNTDMFLPYLNSRAVDDAANKNPTGDEYVVGNSIKVLSAVLLLVSLLAGCSLNSEKLPEPREEPEQTESTGNTRGTEPTASAPPIAEPDRTTNTWSSSFRSREEKLAFLCGYMTMPSEVIDAEYHIVYHDNSGGLIPGPSDWDIRVVLKVAPEDTYRWTDGMKRLVPDQIDIDLWDGLGTEWFTWNGMRGEEDCWKNPDSNEYLVVYPWSSVILKIASTTYMPEYSEIIHEGEVPGYDEYKVLAAEILDYDVSTVQYIKTQQVETGLLTSGSTSTIILFEVRVFGGSLCHYPVLVIITGEDILCEVLFSSGVSYFSDMALADIDGDGYIEILAHNETGGNGGAGSHNTAVYKLAGNRLKTLFYQGFSGTGDFLAFYTGFRLTLANGWLHTVENIFTDYCLSFVRELPYGNPFFDEQGNVTEYAQENNLNKWMGVDGHFYIFRPVDIDDDGKYEIMTAQYTFFWGRSDAVGIAFTLLGWNDEYKTMEVIKAGFWPYTDDYISDSYQEQFQDYREYEENWYRFG